MRSGYVVSHDPSYVVMYRHLTGPKSTEKRSTLRIVREAELLGSELSSYHTRENLILGAKFLREDLPYFIELFAEVVGSTKYERTCHTGFFC